MTFIECPKSNQLLSWVAVRRSKILNRIGIICLAASMQVLKTAYSVDQSVHVVQQKIKDSLNKNIALNLCLYICITKFRRVMCNSSFMLSKRIFDSF